MRREQIQDIENAFEIKRPGSENNHVSTQTAVSKPHSNHKLKVYSRYTHNNEKGNQIILKLVSQDENQKRKGRKKGLQKQIQGN